MKFFSQASQDLFVLKMLNFKKNGTFLEIGSAFPIHNSNTYLLEKDYTWSGIMVEFDSKYLSSYRKERPYSSYIIDDAQKINYRRYLDRCKYPVNMDYLQIDLDVDNKSTLNTLLILDNTVFDKYKFATVTFEHDIYRGDYFNTRSISREIFSKRGYIRIFSDVMVDNDDKITLNLPFEDWYVHPDLVDKELINKYKTDESLRHNEIINILYNNEN
jgi:hypothetical protein